MRKRVTGGTSFDYLYEGKPGDYSTETTSGHPDRLLEHLKDKGVIDSFPSSAGDKSFLFIALSMNLPDLPLKQQLSLCTALILTYQQTSLTPSLYPIGLKEVLEDCCYEDKLQVYDRKTQLKMFIAQKILIHPNNTNEYTFTTMLNEAEGFLAFCLTEDLSGPGEGFNVWETFNRLYRAYTELIGESLSFNCYHTTATPASRGMRP